MSSLDNYFQTLESFSDKTILNLQSSYKNRYLTTHGFSGCSICQCKLMAYLEKGHTFNEVMNILHTEHLEIKNLRSFARTAIRQTTGDGMYDDYIIEHNLWTVRNPIIAPQDVRLLLEEMWKERAKKGRILIDMDKKILHALDGDDDNSRLIEYVIRRYRK